MLTAPAANGLQGQQTRPKQTPLFKQLEDTFQAKERAHRKEVKEVYNATVRPQKVLTVSHSCPF